MREFKRFHVNENQLVLSFKKKKGKGLDRLNPMDFCYFLGLNQGKSSPLSLIHGVIVVLQMLLLVVIAHRKHSRTMTTRTKRRTELVFPPSQKNKPNKSFYSNTE
jgi:hypothetical protein